MLDKNLTIYINGQELHFPCNECKASGKCMNGANCQVVAYISGKLPDVYFRMNNNFPKITIHTDDLTRAESIVNRAIRKRCLSRNK